MKLRSIWLGALALVGCNGPFVTIPGGELGGVVKPVPSDWEPLTPFDTVQLETNPDDPYSVNIACLLVDGVPQINAGDTETQWVQNMNADPRVRLRIHGDVYELAASRITDMDAIAKFGARWVQLGSWARDPTKLDEVWIYRLDAR